MGQHHQLDAESCQGQGQLSRASEGQDCLSTASDFSIHGSYGPCGNTSHGHQCRPWLLLVNGPRHGRWQQPAHSQPHVAIQATWIVMTPYGSEALEHQHGYR